MTFSLNNPFILILIPLILTTKYFQADGVSTDGRIINNNILRYDFRRSDCLNGIFPQQAINSQFSSDLVVNKFHGICPHSNGIQLSSTATKSAVTSALDLSSLLSYLQNKPTFTFEFWIQPKQSSSQPRAQSLLSFSSASSSSCEPLEV
jgi:hypothetical protein